MKQVVVLSSAVWLAACGGSGGSSTGVAGEPPILPPSATPSEAFGFSDTGYTQRTAALGARSNTAFVAPLIEGMPDSGTAFYDGLVRVDLNTTGADTILFGQARVEADFDAQSLSGDVSDVVGRDSGGDVAAYAGDLALTNGDIGVNRPNDFTLDYGGTLTGNGETIALSGTLAGDFKADPILGLLGSDTSPIATVDGLGVTGAVGMAVNSR